MSLSAFYADNHIGRRFGVSDRYSNWHSGVDINGWKAGTRIPSFVAGTIAATGSTSNFGNWVSVRFNDRGVTRFAHYCHLQERPRTKVGDPVPLGADVGPLGNTGYSFGNHLHAMVSGASNPELYSRVIDPLPYILTARGGGGGGGGGGPTRRKKSMSTLYYKENSRLWALAGESPGTPANWLETTGQGFANQLAAIHGAAAVLSAGTWDLWKAHYLAPVKTTGGTSGGGGASKADVDAAAARVIEAVPPLSGAAARTAIVKP